MRCAIAVAGLLLLGVVLFTVSLQNRPSRRFELGGMDYDYLADPSGFHPRLRMSGPLRHSDKRVEVIEFYGRLTRTQAGLRLPYHALRSRLRLRVRCHRFGLDGTVALTVNGEHISDYIFTERSYPWAGIDAVIPERVAEQGPLLIELRVRDAEAPPPHFPEDFGLGIDWIQIEPMSKGVFLRPRLTDVVHLVVFTLLAIAFAHKTGSSVREILVVTGALLAGIALVNAFFPSETGMALLRLWVVFPLGVLLQLLLHRTFGRPRARPSLEAGEIRFLSWIFVLAALSHSLLIFAPDHAPPDLWNHLPQVERLATLEMATQALYPLSTSSDVTADGDERPHFYAPYPPFFYFITIVLAGIHSDGRFLLEFLPVLFGSLMVVMVYILSKAIWNDGVAARLAALLLLVEISLWHHVHRIHSPAVFGELFVLGFLLFLVTRHEALSSRTGRLLLTGVSALALLSYAAPVLQLVLLVAWQALLWPLVARGEERRKLQGLVVGFLAGTILAVAVYYGPYALDAMAQRHVVVERATYDPPAVFFFLRNQMRDTVRILWNGYPIYLLLSLVGLLSLRRFSTGTFHALVLLSSVSTYLTMLVLKDPLLLPRLFIHAKEDLFYGAVACALGALPLAGLWNRPRTRGVVVAVMALLVFLAVRDQSLNVNTLKD